MIWKIAARNLLQHKAKTIIIGSLVTIGILLTLVGNSFIDSVTDVISRIFIKNYTGDILILSSENLGSSVFGSQVESFMEFPVIPILDDYEKILSYMENLPDIESFTTQISTYSMLNLGKIGIEGILLFGINPDSYFKTMNGAIVPPGMGRRLEPGEEGIMLNYETWKRIKTVRNLELKVGDTLQFNSHGKMGFRILELPIVGIFHFEKGNERFFVPSITNIQSARYLYGRNIVDLENIQLDESATAFLDMNLEDFFDSANISIIKPESQSQADIYNIFNQKKTEVEKSDDTGPWNFFIIKMKENADVDETIKNLNTIFSENNIKAIAQGWQASANPDSMIYMGVKLIFNCAIFILAIVSTIIIMNTLVASVMERTAEIGTMRALGARKALIMKMFISETFTITFVFGTIGILAGYLIIQILNLSGIPTDNDLLRFLGGGETVKLVLGSGPVITCFLLMLLIGSTSWIFPVLMAMKITPLKAIMTE